MKYYNYVLKNTRYQEGSVEKAKNGEGAEAIDIKNGLFYLAEIDGNNINRVNNTYNFDNYTKLVSTLATLEADMTAYTEAKDALEKARDKADTLQKEIERLQKTTVDKTAIKALQDAHDKAKKELEDAAKAKKELEDKIKDAEEAIKKIPEAEKKDEEIIEDDPEKKDDEKVEDDPEKKDDEKKEEEPEKKDEKVEAPEDGGEDDPLGPAAEPEDPFKPGKTKKPVKPAEAAPTEDAGTTTPDVVTGTPADDNGTPVVPATQTPGTVEAPAEDNGEVVLPAVIAPVQQGAVLGATREPENTTTEVETGDTVVVEPVKTIEPSEIKQIEDEAVALAKGPFEPNGNFNWVWVLLMGFIAAVIKVVSDDRRNKAEVKKADR